ncbi:calcium-binding protein [Sulfitobacter mediterraneus]|uniref:calcium-binding protein n=1 Tax=Sulfitobacter mediterraneus TaxID=83219 RepID=UPI00248F988E|nr:calcium-binding protein [Sulfitobacter mediterraneus]
MQTLKILATSATLLLGATGLAVAQTDHAHGDQPSDPISENDTGMSRPMAGNQSDMMQLMMPMMQKMHARMTGGGMGLMDYGDRPGMAMIDRNIMKMMMGPGMMGMPSAEDASATMQSRLTEFDANGDGGLSLSEFEALHGAMIREAMVDRFQHLDADGDGKVSNSEMAAPAERMKMRSQMSGKPMDGTGN